MIFLKLYQPYLRKQKSKDFIWWCTLWFRSCWLAISRCWLESLIFLSFYINWLPKIFRKCNTFLLMTVSFYIQTNSSKWQLRQQSMQWQKRIDYVKSFHISCITNIYHAKKSSTDLFKHILIKCTLRCLAFGDVTKDLGQNSPKNKTPISPTTVV